MNNMGIYNLLELVTKNLKKLLFITIIIVLIEFSVGGVILTVYTNYISSQVSNSVYEDSKFNLTKLCSISQCSKVYTDDHIMFDNHNSNLIINHTYIPPEFIIYNISNTYIDTKLNFYIYNETVKSFFLLNTNNIKSVIINSALVITPIVILTFLIILLFSLKDERDISLRALAGNEALLANKSMILITENIHHELNTPMEVIDNKIYKLKNIVDLYIKNTEDKTDTKLKNISRDFELIVQSSEQIHTVLERMRGFKSLRYSNGNKSIYDILRGAFKVISISNSNFNFTIDEKLKLYSIHSNNIKNADLLNIIINHIKNSLEANSDNIHIIFKDINKGNLSIQIVDNGNGIPEKSQSNIFIANFSTKSIEANGIRGNGLYLNKYILETSGGGIQLVASNKYGTTFEITVPVITRNIN